MEIVAMECCGKVRATPFCPECGSALIGHGLRTLLSHCQGHISRLTARLARTRENAANETNEGNRRWAKLTIEKQEKTLAKWEAWVAALERAIGRENAEVSECS